MWTLVRRYVVDTALVIWVVGTLSFTLLHLAPGDPITAAMMDPRVAPSVRAHWRSVYALDRPLPEQYGRYVRPLARGDLGYSFSQNRPVADALRDTLPHSLLLMGTALAGSILLGMAFGTWQALRAGSRGDHLAALISSGLGAVPEVWLALLLLAGFGMELGWFPLSGRCDPVTCGSRGSWREALDVAHHLALPALTLMILSTAPFARVQRITLLRILQDDVIRTARAKGLSAWRILTRHGLRRTVATFATVVGLSLPALIGGAVFVERVFGWPGMGSLLVSAIAQRDYSLVVATSMGGSLMVLFGRLAAELVGAALDPQRRGGTT